MNTNIILFDKWIKYNFKECLDIPGLAICVFDDKKILYKKAFGYANFKTQRKLKITDKFAIGSCTKSIVCLAITLAIKAKEIPNIWSMTLGDIYGKNIHKEFRDVPVKYLASHTSGLTDFNNCPKKMHQLKKYEDMKGIDSRSAISKLLLNQPPHYKPSSEFIYSNLGYDILAGIVEKFINMDYTYIINKYICEPLKIKPNYKLYYTGEGYAEGHKYDGAVRNATFEPLKKNEHINPTYDEPAGEIYLSVIDSAKYLQEYLKASSGQSLIITKSIYNNQIKPISSNGYAFGFWNNTNGEKITHGGSWFCTGTRYTILPKKSIGIVINCNNADFNTVYILNKFYEIFTL